MSVNSTHRRVLITGGSGFIGTNLVEFLSKKGDTILNLDSLPPKNHQHSQYWKICDILDPQGLRQDILNFKPSHLIHLAARTDLHGKTIGSYAANTDGVQYLIQAIQECETLKRVIYASSRMVCPIGYQPKDALDTNPPNAYGASKVKTEELVRSTSGAASWIIVRPTSIWGPWFGVPYRLFFDAIRSQKYFNPGSHNPRKSFGYIGNTVYQLDKLLEAPEADVNHATLYLCDYPPLRLQEWADMVRRALGTRPIRTVPYFLLSLMAKVCDATSLIGFAAPLTSFRLSNLITDMVYDTQKLEKICGPLPHTIDEGVQETVAWLLKEKN